MKLPTASIPSTRSISLNCLNYGIVRLRVWKSGMRVPFLPAMLAAGARRYLLRLETSNPDLYAALHPDAMSWQRRVDCLNALKEVGYMVSISSWLPQL